MTSSSRRALTCLCVAVVATAACPAPIEPGPPTRMFAGTVPNAVTLTACDGRRVAVVAASIEARVNIIDVADGTKTSLLLPERSNPWDVAVFQTSSGLRGVVSLYGDDTVALFDPCARDPIVLDSYRDEQPIAVDDDAIIDEMLPQTPQALAADADGASVLVTFTNIIAVATDEPMRTGPGLLTRLRVVDDALVADGRVTLPCKNPSSIVIDGARVVVACSGVFKSGDDGFERGGPGGLVAIDRETLSINAAVDVDAAPASIIVHDGDIVTGDALDGTIARYGLDLIERERTAAADGVDTVFALDVIDGVLVAAHFDDRLIADPFGERRETSIAVGDEPRGIVDLVHDDDDVFALLSTSGELVRLDSSTVIGAAP